MLYNTISNLWQVGYGDDLSLRSLVQCQLYCAEMINHHGVGIYSAGPTLSGIENFMTR
jgi:hypothetical protein